MDRREYRLRNARSDRRDHHQQGVRTQTGKKLSDDYLDFITPASFVYGIDPFTLSSAYEIPEVIALAKAAQRFLMRYPQVHPRIQQQTGPVEQQSPDTAGFRTLFGSHFKPVLE
ncbi:MAG TPA: hypothetical protein O0X27_05175 [Methanocorpusculum sp.]|nr:hypothetical protein [Methanocorpusculum sp.]